MKRILLSTLSFVILSTVSAQVEITVDGTGPDVSGTTVVVNVDASTEFPYDEHFIVTNSTGSDAQWRITRVKQSVPAGWSDLVCWPPQCFIPSSDLYVTPNSGGTPAPTIVNGTSQTTNGELAELKPKITPDMSSNSSATYMYYITDLSGNYVDSVGLQLNFTLGIEEQAPSLSVNVAPNPASDYIKVKAEGVHGATAKIMDVLGNIVMKETIIGSSKTIDVSKFRNGIYFIVVEAPGAKTVNRKVIVRH